MDFVQLEAFLSLWKQAVAQMDESQAEQWQQKATATVTYLESNHGPYWGRLGELELLRAAGKTSGGGNVEILQRTADNLYRRGQLKEAIATYEKAASQANNLGQTSSAFDLLFKAALVEQKADEHRKASQRLRQLSLSMKAQPKSAEAHLLAGWNLAQATRAAPELLSEYAEVLEEHIDHWPKNPTSHTARMWLGRVREREQDWKAAVAAYQGVAAEHKDFTEAVSATGRCWLQWLQQQQAAGQPTKVAAEVAAQYFESLVVGPEKKWPERWTPAQRAAALLAAQLRLDFAEDSFATAETMLSAALHYCVDASDAWQATAQSMLVVALAGQPGKRQEARRLLEKLGSGSTDRLLDLISSLSTLARQATPQMRGELAQLQLAALAKLEEGDGPLDESTRIRIPQVKAEALAASGRIDEALALYRSLVRQYPNNREIHFDMAQLLLDGGTKSASQQALDEWSRIAKRCRRGTEEWYRAKYSIALAYYKLGKRTEAVKRIRYWKATSDIDQSDWKARFDKLLAKCEG
jgi:tetratricopeptide (TPR) repeat protein